MWWKFAYSVSEVLMSQCFVEIGIFISGYINFSRYARQGHAQARSVNPPLKVQKTRESDEKTGRTSVTPLPRRRRRFGCLATRKSPGI